MERIAVEQLIETTKELINNLILRTDSILKEFEERQTFLNDRIIFILDDFTVLAEAIDIIQKQNSNIHLEELTEKLNLLYDSMQSKDKLMFKDITEFELRPLLEYWLEVIEFTVKH